jgi:hypothetical protein
MLRQMPSVEPILRSLGRWPAFQSILQRKSVPSWTDTFYAHPLIRSLAQLGTKPSYIPEQNFRLVLFDMVMTTGTEATIIRETLYALRAQIRNLSRVSEKDRSECERILSAAVAQVKKLVDLSRPGKIHSSN